MNREVLVGRERETRAVTELVSPGPDGPRTMAILGDPGSGRTALLGVAAAEATAAGRRVLVVAGLQGERDVPLSGLSHLLLPFVERIESLPDAHRSALRRPLGLADESEPFDLVATGMAVLALMMQRPDSPILVAVDDADRVDTETLAVLAFVAQRVDRARAVLLLAVESGRVPAAFERHASRVDIDPLTDDESRLLLERRAPALPRGLSERIVAQSAGNPLVLLETAAAAPSRTTLPRSKREPLRPGSLIEERILARIRGLPAETRDRLGDLAVLESSGSRASPASVVAPAAMASLVPAERAGVVRLDHTGVRFTHPAYWITLVGAMPFSALVDAHCRAADAVVDQPSRRAWHLARAALEPDEAIASLLQDRANDIGREHGRLEKAFALERSAELTPDGDDRARRLLAAALTAGPTGEMAWIDELTGRAMSCVNDPGLRVKAITTSAWAQAARGRFSAALADLSRAASETADTAPDAAWEVLSIAAAYGYQSGSLGTHAQMRAVVRRLESAQEPATPVARARRLWVESFLFAGLGTPARLVELRRLGAEAPADEPSLSRLGGAAWLDDESEAAFAFADGAYPRLREQGSYAAAAVIGPILSWTTWDTGRWDDALEFAADTSRTAALAGGGMLQATDDAVAALVLAARGDAAGSEARAQAALDLIEGEECLSVVSRIHQARGLSALATGRFAEAYAHLSRLFREDGTPLHWHIALFGLADLASAAQRSDQVEAARVLVGRVIDRLPPDPATRIRHLALRARALLAETDDEAERLFVAAQADPAGSRWPFERAMLLLDHGSWLRRRKRVGEAKPLLTQAHDLFDRLDAAPWKARAEAELRASHVEVPRLSSSLGDLTDQQREIVLLAGKGLTNREIAARMYLSPRTVASHLYRSFPKLGIRDRWQLRDLVDSHDPLTPPTSPAEAPSVG